MCEFQLSWRNTTGFICTANVRWIRIIPLFSLSSCSVFSYLVHIVYMESLCSSSSSAPPTKIIDVKHKYILSMTLLNCLNSQNIKYKSESYYRQNVYMNLTLVIVVAPHQCHCYSIRITLHFVSIFDLHFKINKNTSLFLSFQKKPSI